MLEIKHYIIVGSLLLVSLLLHIPQQATSSVPIDVPEALEVNTLARHTETKDELIYLVRKYANKYGVSFSDMFRVIECESNWNPNIQSRHRYDEGQIARNPHWGNVGDYEKSFGLVQIHLPAHPTVTEEMAKDPEFAIDFMAKMFSKGKQSQWSCF